MEVMGRQRASRLALLVVLASPFAVLPGVARAADPPPAQAVEEAKTRYSRGVELYNEGSYGPALLELERANSLAPNYRILYSIGLVQVQLGDFVAALRSFENYLAAGGSEIDGERKKEVGERLVSLRGRVATDEISVPVADAEIALDDVAVGKSPLPQPLVVNPGKHKIVAQKTGYGADTKVFTVAGSDKIRISLEPSEQTAAPVAATTDVPAATTSSGSSLVLVGWIATGVFAAGAVTTGVMALSKSNELKDHRANQPTSRADLDGLSSSAKTLGLVSDIFTGATVVAGGLSLWLTLRNRDEAPVATPAPAPAAGMPKVQVGFGRVDLVGQF